jgi:pyrroloquinoline-quinone synthase
MQLEELLNREYLEGITNHSLIKRLKGDHLNKQQVAFALGQYWHPIHFFPDFLASLVNKSPRIALKTHISKILYQELGEGNINKAHEILFLEAMMDDAEIKQTEATLETKALMDSFQQSSNDYLLGLGFLYATEAIDLTIVTGLASAVKKVSGAKTLAWEDIHELQEADHTCCTSSLFNNLLLENEDDKVIEATHAAWKLWATFFDGLERGILNLAKEKSF